MKSLQNVLWIVQMVHGFICCHTGRDVRKVEKVDNLMGIECPADFHFVHDYRDAL